MSQVDFAIIIIIVVVVVFCRGFCDFCQRKKAGNPAKQPKLIRGAGQKKKRKKVTNCQSDNPRHPNHTKDLNYFEAWYFTVFYGVLYVVSEGDHAEFNHVASWLADQ